MPQHIDLSRELITSPCPSCGHIQERETYDIGSGRELCCVVCDWCWGADGQDLTPITVNHVRTIVEEAERAHARIKAEATVLMAAVVGSEELVQDEDGAPYPGSVQVLIKAASEVLRHGWEVHDEEGGVHIFVVPKQYRDLLAEIVAELKLAQ